MPMPEQEVFREHVFKEGDHECIVIKTRGYGDVIEVMVDQLGVSVSHYLSNDQAAALSKVLAAAVTK